MNRYLTHPIAKAVAIIALSFLGMGAYYVVARMWHVYWFADAAYVQSQRDVATQNAIDLIRTAQQEQQQKQAGAVK